MAQDQVTSLSLLERARAQDATAWQKLATLYRPLVYYWCQRGGAGPEDAHDVVQEVLLAVAGGLQQFQREGTGSFRAWVRGITRHKLLDHHRRQQRQPAAAAGGTDALLRVQELPDPASGSEDESAEVGGLYRRALDLIRSEFEERTWLAFWNTAVENRDTATVAAELGMSAVAVRIAKSRVLGRLREEAAGLID
jgi:RNA polymerase sigma-70 factor (ECF subfamily)